MRLPLQRHSWLLPKQRWMLQLRDSRHWNKGFKKHAMICRAMLALLLMRTRRRKLRLRMKSARERRRCSSCFCVSSAPHACDRARLLKQLRKSALRCRLQSSSSTRLRQISHL
jgi:hypothetical protein